MKNSLILYNLLNGENLEKKPAVKVIRENGLQLTIHPIPHTNLQLAIYQKGRCRRKQMLDELEKIGKR